MNGKLKVGIFYVILIGVLIIAITSFLSTSKNDDYSYGDIYELFTSKQVAKCNVGNDNILYIETTDNKKEEENKNENNSENNENSNINNESNNSQENENNNSSSNNNEDNEQTEDNTNQESNETE